MKQDFQHESCECKFRLNESVCNSNQKWNHHECRCECKELVDYGYCKDDYMWNSSTCDCDCIKARKFDSDDNLTLKKALKPYSIIIVRSAFHKGNKYHPQVFLDECLYKL